MAVAIVFVRGAMSNLCANNNVIAIVLMHHLSRIWHSPTEPLYDVVRYLNGHTHTHLIWAERVRLLSQLNCKHSIGHAIYAGFGTFTEIIRWFWFFVSHAAFWSTLVLCSNRNKRILNIYPRIWNVGIYIDAVTKFKWYYGSILQRVLETSIDSLLLWL